jgi:hypothetical protein
MHPTQAEIKEVAVKVIEVLPRTGLAWVQSDDLQEWALTRSTPGVDLEGLRPGQQMRLRVQDHHGRNLPVACH